MRSGTASATNHWHVRWNPSSDPWPRSRAGDFIDLHAQLDLIVGITACSAEKSNNGALKPIEVEVREGQ